MAMTIHGALMWASSFLREHHRDENGGEWLLRHRLGLTRARLLAAFSERLTDRDWEWFQAQVKRLSEGVPVQHILGFEEFYGRRFEVNEHVLIPRPETEELVQEILQWKRQVFKAQPVRYVDVGTGSGAIAVTLKLEDPESQVFAVDLSEKALEVAARNANRLGADVVFQKGDLLTPFIGQATFDIVVSNPPYIPTEDIHTLDDVVKHHEPHLALDGGPDGLVMYRRLCRDLPKVLASPGIVGFEVGCGQAEAVRTLLAAAFPNKANVYVKRDISNKERMCFAVTYS